MSATSNSVLGRRRRDVPAESPIHRAKCVSARQRTTTVLLLSTAAWAIVLLGAAPAVAASEIATRAKLLAAGAYADARALYRAAPTNSEIAWQFGRACFDWAEFATNNTQRAEIAEQGIAACRRLIAREPKSAPGHYYLAMNLGQLARTKHLGALKIVDEMEREFKSTRDLDEHFDYAGPDRNLGLLYFEAPVIGSIGSRSKARQHLQRAVEVAPAYPENRLNLIEADLKWGDRNGARRELAALDAFGSVARTNFAGDTWAASWVDWEARLKKARWRTEEAARPIVSPRNKS